ncbi:metallophosphoesterase [Phyllobacterium lublinensis]|uniref:metallophosphoesterase n=1 Tax=Phyllobacterium lublinensis TaxID=2875708 RepID=UPI001CCF60E6|nr:metallophosphoesterase [Phyllobacterium sp. 2063]MBZ9654330.1 metallophosphoesterase [Phyllobacterium sp. 2063]
MKRSTFVLMLGLAFVAQPALSLVGTGEALAVRKNVSEYAGQRCSPPPRGSGVIIGRFQGYMDSPMISNGDSRWPVSAYRCFRSFDECRGWLYTMQSKYIASTSNTIACERR